MEKSLKAIKWYYRIYYCRLCIAFPKPYGFTDSFEIFFLKANFVLKGICYGGVQI